MNNTDTQKIRTKITGTEVEIRNWITGRQREEINKVILNAVQFDPTTQDGTATNVGNAIVEQGHKEIEAYVVSVNGKTENVLDAILSLPEADTQEVRDAIKKKVPEGVTPQTKA